MYFDLHKGQANNLLNLLDFKHKKPGLTKKTHEWQIKHFSYSLLGTRF